MLPSRPTLRAWNPDALSAAAAEVRAQAQAVVDAVTGIADACERMPETRLWSGQAHDAALAMFDRGRIAATKFFDYADSVASALCRGADVTGQARKAPAARVSGGGWAMAELGAAVGAAGGPVAPVTIPTATALFALGGSAGGAKLGTLVGEVLCP